MMRQQISEQERSQLDKFKKAARDLDCDDDEQRFKERLKEVAKPVTKEPPHDR